MNIEEADPADNIFFKSVVHTLVLFLKHARVDEVGIQRLFRPSLCSVLVMVVRLKRIDYLKLFY